MQATEEQTDTYVQDYYTSFNVSLFHDITAISTSSSSLPSSGPSPSPSASASAPRPQRQPPPPYFRPSPSLLSDSLLSASNSASASGLSPDTSPAPAASSASASTPNPHSQPQPQPQPSRPQPQASALTPSRTTASPTPGASQSSVSSAPFQPPPAVSVSRAPSTAPSSVSHVTRPLLLDAYWGEYNDRPGNSAAGRSREDTASTSFLTCSLASLFKKDRHMYARSQVDLVTLHRDRAAKKGLSVFSGLCLDPDRIVAPEFLDGLPTGAEGIWSIFDVLCDEGEKEFANAVLTGSKLSASTLTGIVISKLSRLPKFHQLYLEHCSSELVPWLIDGMIKAGLFQPPPRNADGEEPDLTRAWDFNTGSIDGNAFICLLRQNLITYMELLAKNFMCTVRFQAARLAIQCETMGLHLLPGEDEKGMVHMHPASKRSAVADKILKLIYPSNKRATNADKLSALRRYFLSESIARMANCIVGEVGKVNIGLGIVGTKSSESADIPHLIFPLAATLIHVELMAVKFSRDQPNGRSGLFQNFVGFSKSDQSIYEALSKVWSTVIYLNPHRDDPPVASLLQTLVTDQEIARAVHLYRTAQDIAKNGGQRPLPPSMIMQPPPSYSSVAPMNNQNFVSLFTSFFQ